MVLARFLHMRQQERVLVSFGKTTCVRRPLQTPPPRARVPLWNVHSRERKSFKLLDVAFSHFRNRYRRERRDNIGACCPALIPRYSHGISWSNRGTKGAMQCGAGCGVKGKSLARLVLRRSQSMSLLLIRSGLTGLTG